MDVDGYVAGEGRCLRHSEEKSNRSSGVLVPPLNSTYHISRNSYEIQKIKSEFIKSESDVLPGGGRSSLSHLPALRKLPATALSHRPPQAAILGQRIEPRPPACDGLSAVMLSRGIFHTDR